MPHPGDSETVQLEGQRAAPNTSAGVDASEPGHAPLASAPRRPRPRQGGGKVARLDWHKPDRYGRLVGKVWAVLPDARCQHAACPKTLDVGLTQISQGLAWHYKKYAHEQSEEDRERYAFAELEARARRAGLWRDPAPVAPWEWRRSR